MRLLQEGSESVRAVFAHSLLHVQAASVHVCRKGVRAARVVVLQFQGDASDKFEDHGSGMIWRGMAPALCKR